MHPSDIIDRQLITDLFIAYSRALDEKDWAALAELFVPDVTTDWLGGSARQSDRGAMIDYIRYWIEDVATQHLLGNHHAVIDGDRATASCYVRAFHGGRGDRQHLFQETIGRYEARLARVDGAWRFTFYSERMFAMTGGWDVFGDKTQG